MVASVPRKLRGNRTCGRVLILGLPTHLVQDFNASTVTQRPGQCNCICQDTLESTNCLQIADRIKGNY